MARPFLAELAVITDTVVATQQTDDSRSCRISAEAVAAGGFNSSGTPSLMNRQAEQTADQAAENMARIHQEIEDTKSAQTVALSEGEAVVAAAHLGRYNITAVMYRYTCTFTTFSTY